jgi:hypothetical protein
LGGALRTGALAPGYAAELSLGVLVSSTGVSHQSPRRDRGRREEAEVTEPMRLERSRLESFFGFCCIDLSFITLRWRTRQDIEVMGNGYWEVLRDGGATSPSSCTCRPAPFALDGTQVRKGTWLLTVRVLDDALWAQIQAAA